MRIAKKFNYPKFINGQRTVQTAIHNDMIFNFRINLQLLLILAKWQNQFAKLCNFFAKV